MRFVGILLIVFCIVGIPNYFVKYDPTALTRVNSGIDINVVIRISLFFVIAYLNLLFLFDQQVLYKKYLSTIKFPLFFYLSYVILLVFGAHLEILKSLYRAFEWFSFFFLLYHLQVYSKSYLVIKDYLRIIYVLSLYVMFIVFFSLLLKRDMVWVCSSIAGCRLGGYVINPNTLGVIAGISFVYFLVLGKGIFERIILSLISLIILFLTYSRGAILGLIISLLPFVIAKNRYRTLLCLLFGMLIISTIFYMDDIVLFLSRKEGIENLLTLSERVFVFKAALELYMQYPVFGAGFIGGTKQISDIMFHELGISYWTNFHAHNEFLQALSSGGILMFFLSLSVFIKIIYNIISIPACKYEKLFLVSLFLQLLTFSFLMTTISWTLSVLPALIWLLYIALENEKESNRNANIG